MKKCPEKNIIIPKRCEKYERGIALQNENEDEFDGGYKAQL